MKKTRICFIVPKSYPIFNPKIRSYFGGAEVQLVLIGRELSQIYTFDINYMVADYKQPKIEERDRIKLWNSYKFKDIIVRQMVSFFRRFREIDADIYFQQTLTPFSGIIALYCKIMRKKFIYLVANDGEADKSHQFYQSWIKYFLAKLVFRYSSLIVCQNSYQKDKLVSRNIESVVIKTGYSIVDLQPQKKDYMLWVGRSHPIKRPKLFLKLAKSNPNQKFIMICPASTYHKEVFDEVKKMSMNLKNLEFIDFVPFQKIDPYFQKSRVFINTSIQEGFPNTFVQATKNKTPIISLAVNPDNFLTEFKCGFFCENNFDLMNKYLNELIDNEELYDTMSNNAFVYAKKMHEIKSITKNLLIYINRFCFGKNKR